MGRLALLAALVVTSVTSLARSEPAEAVKGEQVSAADHPWAVRVTRSNGRPLCTGTAIATRWVLTSAHCLIDESQPKGSDRSVKSPGDIGIVFGRTDPSSNAGFTRGVERLIVHPEYFRSRNAEYDVALIKLSSSVGSGSVLQLGDSGSLRTGDALDVYGYGVDDDIVASGDLDAIDADAFLRTETLTVASAPGHEILYAAEGPRSLQLGDSGAPLVHAGRLVGVHFGAFPSGSYEGYGVPISPHRGWIDLVMEVAASSTNRRFRIETGFLRECLDLQFGFGNMRRLSSPAPCNGGDSSQQYQFTVESNGMFVVSNRIVSTCLGMEGGTSAGSDSRVWTWDCNGKDSQNWMPVRVEASGSGFSVGMINRARPDLQWSVRHVGGASRLVVRPVGRWGTSSEVFRLVPAS